ncbi:hypothetical protein PCK2_000490, partial [Pneumocystis canis]
GGRYHGKIFLPAEYPFRPPSFRFCHENGRFAVKNTRVNKEICLNISSFHEELWQPVWGIHTALISLSNFMLTKCKEGREGQIGGLDFSEKERRRIAIQSREWICPECNRRNIDILPDLEGQSEQDFLRPEIPKLCFAYKDEDKNRKNKIMTCRWIINDCRFRVILIISFIFLLKILKMNHDDPDAPREGRLGSIVPNKREGASMKDVKMRFVPKSLCKRKNEREKEPLDVILKEEEIQLLSEEEQGNMLDVDQDHEKIQIKMETSEKYINTYEYPLTFDASESLLMSQEKEEISKCEIHFDDELLESDEDGIPKINMEKLNTITNNDFDHRMLPVSRFFIDSSNHVAQSKADKSYTSIHGERIESERQASVLKNELEDVYVESEHIQDNFSDLESQSDIFNPISCSLDEKTDYIEVSFTQKQERERILNEFKLLKHLFTDQLSNHTKNSDELLFFQFPPILPTLFNSDDIEMEKPEIKVENDDMNIDIQQTIFHQTAFSNDDMKFEKSPEISLSPYSRDFNTQRQWPPPDGCIGQLKIHQSGKTTIVWGGIEMDVNLGSDCGFLQDIVALDYKMNKNAWLMGRIKHKFVVTPDIERLLE